MWNSGTIALAELGANGRYTAANGAFCRLLETDEDTLRSWSYERFGHPLDLDAELAAWQRIQDGASAASYQRRFRSAREREFTALVHCHGGPSGTLMLLVLPLDVPTSARPPGDDRSWNALCELGNALSHDAVEPVRMSSMQVSLIERDPLTPRAADSCASLTASLQLVRQRLQALSDYARLGRPQPAPAPVPLRSLLVQALVDLPPPALAIDCGDGEVRCDPRQVARALRELLFNAERFAHPGAPGHARISVATGANGAVLSVSDSGIGIPQADHARLFRLFAVGGRRPPFGTGLGLALCRAVAEGHGGRAWIAVSSPGGTTVSLSFQL